MEGLSRFWGILYRMSPLRYSPWCDSHASPHRTPLSGGGSVRETDAALFAAHVGVCALRDGGFQDGGAADAVAGATAWPDFSAVDSAGQHWEADELGGVCRVAGGAAGPGRAAAGFRHWPGERLDRRGTAASAAFVFAGQPDA